MQRPTGPLCDGCHSVNYSLKTKVVTEWNVGREKCHGAGSLHVARQTSQTIVNPVKLDEVRSDDVCIQCHSQGRPRANPIEGRYYDWPVGYQPGDRLADVWQLEERHLGAETFTHWPDGTGHKNRMHWHRQRPGSHVPIHHADGVGTAPRAESVRHVSHRQVEP